LGIGHVETEYPDPAGGVNAVTEGTGLTLHGGGGVVFNRTSTVQLRFQARYVVGLFSLESPREDFPRAVLVRMELAFGR
jgi:hypothetical protein